MNYLAHVLLSGQDPQWQLGGLLGDFIKGPLPNLDSLECSSSTTPAHLLDAQNEPWSRAVLQGVRLHRRLDVFTDADSDTQQCLALLGPSCRRFGAIALDVFLDHLLSRHWDEFHDQSLDHFSDHFYGVCEQQHNRLPRAAAGFIRSAANHHLFAGYGRWSVFEQVLESIDRRIRFDSNVSEVGAEIKNQYHSLESILLPFMVRAQQQAKNLRGQSRL
ncbi:MAG: ACP phosphodiesterase [Cellvibrionaceae bacterium]